LRADPLFWLRFEFSPKFQKSITLEQNGTNHGSVRFSFVEGNGRVFMDVELFSGTNRNARLGGDESTFFGFRDVDGDGKRELLFTATSIHGTGRSLWKFVEGQWTEVPLSLSALRTLEVAELLFYAPLILLFSVPCCLFGMLLLVCRGKSVSDNANRSPPAVQ
jgi:hypothetical protein